MSSLDADLIQVLINEITETAVAIVLKHHLQNPQMDIDKNLLIQHACNMFKVSISNHDPNIQATTTSKICVAQSIAICISQTFNKF